jgi:hypothetical protein
MVVVWLLVAATGTPSEARTCRGGGPGVNKLGFRPHATVPVTVMPSPSGRPFPPAVLACVWRAFDAWTAVNAQTALDVRFVPGEGGIVVRFDDERHLLPKHVAGAWSHGERAHDGALVGATIWLTPNEKVLDSCDGVTKTVLHELGHLHGLADHSGPAGATVMNHLGSKNDRGGRLPMAPTACDAAQAALASASLGRSETGPASDDGPGGRR